MRAAFPISRPFVARALALALTAGFGCSDPGPISVAGRVVDVDLFVRARLGDLPGPGAAAMASVAGAVVSVAERTDVVQQTTAADGSFAFPEIPSRKRLHLVADASGFCPTYDGIGLQFPEDDVAGFSIGALSSAGFAKAVAANASAPDAANAAMDVFLLMDSAPFPAGEILRDHITAVLTGGGRVIYGGWDPDASGFVIAAKPEEFVAPVRFAGLVAVLDADEGTRIEFKDGAAADGLRPAFFLVYSVKPQASRCVFHFLRAIGSGV